MTLTMIVYVTDPWTKPYRAFIRRGRKPAIQFTGAHALGEACAYVRSLGKKPNVKFFG